MKNRPRTFKLRILRPADFVILAIFLAVIAVFLVFILRYSRPSNEKRLVIQSENSDGKTTEWIYSMNKNERAEIPGILGTSIIVIENGKAFFEDSPCENKICVFSHKISHSGEWIACLPNGVIIRVEGKNSDFRQNGNTDSNDEIDPSTDYDAWAE